jgi:hypothetical protein
MKNKLFEDVDREELNRKHRSNPEIGDYWNEMFVPVLVVLDIGRAKTGVLICETIKDVDSQHWTWDLSKTQWVSLAEFARKISYDTPSLDDKCFADVVPRAHVWASEALWSNELLKVDK